MRFSKPQKKNLARLFFELAKIIFALAIVAPIVSPQVLAFWKILLGFAMTFLFIVLGLLTDREE